MRLQFDLESCQVETGEIHEASSRSQYYRPSLYGRHLDLSENVRWGRTCWTRKYVGSVDSQLNEPKMDRMWVWGAIIKVDEAESVISRLLKELRVTTLFQSLWVAGNCCRRREERSQTAWTG